LFSINGSPTLLSDHLNGVLILHPELDKRRGHEDRGPAEPGDAVDPDAGVGVGLELLVDEVQPLVHDLLGGGRPVREAKLRDSDLLVLELLGVVELVGGANEVGHFVLLQQPDVVVHRPVLRLVGDEEAHVPPQVGELYLRWSRSDDLTSHFDVILLSINLQHLNSYLSFHWSTIYCDL